MRNTHFQFKEFRIEQAQAGMKVTTDGCLFGAWVADEIKESSVKKVLDIGAGTGVLTLMLAQKSTAGLEAIELNDLAFEEAKQNIQASPWHKRIKLHQGDIQSFKGKKTFDLIICNPPFFHQNKKGDQDHRNTAIHNDSLSAKDLATSIAKLLDPMGIAYVMYPSNEMNDFMKLAEIEGLQPTHCASVKDNPKGAVIRKMCGFTKTIQPIQISNIIIKTASGSYSREFTRLLSDYYLDI